MVFMQGERQGRVISYNTKVNLHRLMVKFMKHEFNENGDHHGYLRANFRRWCKTRVRTCGMKVSLYQIDESKKKYIRKPPPFPNSGYFPP